MIIWTTLFALLLSITIFGFNLLILLTIAINSELHTITNNLSCNLWLANCIIGAVNGFHNLFYNVSSINPIIFVNNNYASLKKSHRTHPSYYITTNDSHYPPSIILSNNQQKSSNINPKIDLSSLFTRTLMSPSMSFLKLEKYSNRQ